ncbi:MAG: hypothetical protein ACAI35_24910, partial [Candidatus Methylacidiphilales bacterium]|nr:hypothetical protein [Candidatus Methylacidiphilales bacterium]
MIIQIFLALCLGCLLYAALLRFMWRKKRAEADPVIGARRRRIDLMLYMLPQAEEGNPPAIAATDPAAKIAQDSELESEASKALREWDFSQVGVVGEKVPPPNWFLLPATTLYCKLWPHPVFADCRLSPD